MDMDIHFFVFGRCSEEMFTHFKFVIKYEGINEITLMMSELYKIWSQWLLYLLPGLAF
jgi:hypothetical protein